MRVDLIGRFADPASHVGRINFGINAAAERGFEEIVREPDIVVVALPILPGQRKSMAQHVALCKRPEVLTRDWQFQHAISLNGLEAWGNSRALLARQGTSTCSGMGRDPQRLFCATSNFSYMGHASPELPLANKKRTHCLSEFMKNSIR